MPVPSAISSLSQTPGSNSPAGSESPALLDDYHRTTFAFIAKLRDGQGFSNPVDLASAATTDIGAQTSPVVRITGTTTITSFGANYAGPRFLVFGGALTLTHNATSLILPGGANITTAAGDTCIAVPNLATPTGWRVLSYQKASLSPGAPDPGSLPSASTSAKGAVELATDAEAQAGTSTSLVVTPANMKSAQIQLATSVALTNQTSVDFTGIPSWANRVTVMFSGVSTNGTSSPIIQIGDSGGVEVTGYLGASTSMDTGVASSNFTTGFGIRSATAAAVLHGFMSIVRQNGNTWAARGDFGGSSAPFCIVSGGSKTLSDVLDRVRLTTGNGTDQFDAGSVSISWE